MIVFLVNPLSLILNKQKKFCLFDFILFFVFIYIVFFVFQFLVSVDCCEAEGVSLLIFCSNILEGYGDISDRANFGNVSSKLLGDVDISVISLPQSITSFALGMTVNNLHLPQVALFPPRKVIRS